LICGARMNSSIFRIAVAGALVALSAAPAHASEKPDRCLVCIERAEEASKKVWPLANRGSALTKIALAYARSGHFIEAERVVGEIRDEGWKIYAIMEVNNYSQIRQQNPDIAKRLIATAKESTLTLTDAGRRDSYFRQIVYHQALNRQIDEAFKTTELIATETERDHALRAIARARLQNGDIDGALETAESIRSSSQWKDSVLAEIAGAVARADNLERARAIADGVRHKFPTPDTSLFGPRANDKSKSPEERLAFARQIPHPAPRAIALRILGDDAILADNRAIGRMAYRDAIAAEREKATSHSMSEIGTKQARAGFIDDAIETAKILEGLAQNERSIPNRHDPVGLLCAIAKAQHRAGQKDAARKTAASANQMVSKNGYQNHPGTIALVDMAAAMGDIEFAQRIAGQLPGPQPFSTEPTSRANAWQAIAVQLARSGDYDGALEAITEIGHVRTADNALTQIVIEQLWQGRLAEALATVERITNAWERVVALTEMAMAHTRPRPED
jgi:tetratricopeptide (TPR) repeat protein